MDKSDIMSYTGGDKPPTLVVTFTAAPGQDNLPNLKRTIELYGIKPQNKFTIERMAIAHSVDTTSAPQFLNGISSIFNNFYVIHYSIICRTAKER